MRDNIMEEKKFVLPTLEIISFYNEDIITDSETDINGSEIEDLA